MFVLFKRVCKNLVVLIFALPGDIKFLLSVSTKKQQPVSQESFGKSDSVGSKLVQNRSALQ